MSKYIDAERLKAEIEKRLKNVRDYMRGVGMKYKGPKYFKAQGKESAYDALLNIVTSLQLEQPEVNLEAEINAWYNTMGIPVSSDALKETARHFYELGKARKEE